MEYQIQANTRKCAASGRELRPGEKFFSVLLDREGRFVRHDFSAEAWQGPSTDAFSFWSGKVPAVDDSRRPRIDDELLMDCFERLADQSAPGRLSFRYVVALLLMRRKRLKFEEAHSDGDGEVLSLRCARTGVQYRVTNPRLSDVEMETVQDEVFQVLGWS